MLDSEWSEEQLCFYIILYRKSDILDDLDMHYISRSKLYLVGTLFDTFSLKFL